MSDPNPSRAPGERRKRKGRSESRQEFVEHYRARSEAKNEEARGRIEPLAEGERPGVVTVGAVISGLIALSIVIAYVAGAEVDGERPKLAQVLAPSAMLTVMSVGMFRARYWAVLGFQALLGLLLLGAALGLLQAGTPLQAIGDTVLVLGSGLMFFLMVRAMARIQMPDRRSPDG